MRASNRILALLALFNKVQVQAQTPTSSAIITQTGLGAATSAVPSATPTTYANITVNDRPSGVLNATAWSLVYTYPLYIFANFAGTVLQNVAINQIFHQQQLASIESSAVIKPNVDTVYSRVVLDLSKNDVVLTIPPISDRYWVYPVIDAFGNIIAEIGVVNNNTAGDYLIRRSDDVGTTSGYQNESTIVASTITSLQAANKYAGIVNVPTTHGTMLIRFLVRQNTTADIDIIHGYQNASRLTEIPRAASIAPSPSGNLSSLAPNGSLLNIFTPEKLFNFAAKFVPYNQPEIFSERQRVAGILGQAGIYDGVYTPQTGINLTVAAQIANASITADISNPAHIRQEGNDWQLSIPEYQGNFGINYASRAYVAIAGYQQQTVAQTLYPGYKSLGFSSVVSLAPNTSLLFTFSGKPKLQGFGFWSITVYGANQYLIPNPINRPSVGDRTFNITYQNSTTPVYGPSANATRDGPFQILVQPANLVPPANWTSNWLPTAQDFSFITRWYTPYPAMTNGSYVYPKVETIKAII